MQFDNNTEQKTCFLTCWLHPPPDDQVHLSVSSRPVHQVNDVSVRLPHHGDPIHKQQLVTGPQASVQVCWTLLDDRPDQDLLLLHVDCYIHRKVRIKDLDAELESVSHAVGVNVIIVLLL